MEYLPKTSLKGQVLTDFVAEFTNISKEKGCGETDLWVIDVDGLMNKRSSGAGMVVKPPEGQELRYAI